MDNIDGQIESVNKSSDVNRNIGITFSLLLFYITISVLGTTDRLLLFPDSTISLPLLNVNLPVNEFYVIAPIIIVIANYNFLIYLNKHQDKLDNLNHILKENSSYDEFRNMLNPFIFNQLLDSGKTRPQRILRTAVHFLFFTYPLLLICLIGYRFSDSQTPWTYFHLSLIILNGFICSNYSKRFSKVKVIPNQKKYQSILTVLRTRYWIALMFLILLISILGIDKKLIDNTIALNFLLLASPTSVIITLCSILLLNALEYMAQSTIVRIIVTLVLSYFAVYLLVLIGIISIDFEQVAKYRSVLPHISVSDQKIVQFEPLDQILTMRMNGMDEDVISKFKTNSTVGYNLGNRKLVFSDFSNCDLTNVRFNNSDLSYANLDKAVLVRANLRYSSMTDASLIGSDLAAVELENTDFSRSNFLGAKNLNFSFSDAIWEETYLDSINFSSKNLKNAIFKKTSFRGSFLDNVRLTGATFHEAVFKGAYLNNVRLKDASWQGSDFREAILDTVYFQDALKLQSINLSGQDLSKRNFFRAQMQGVKMLNVRLNNAFLKFTNLQGAEISDSWLQGALLWYTDLRGANLDSCGLRGSNFWNTSLQGAVLSNSNVSGSSLLQVHAQGADIRGTSFYVSIFEDVNLRNVVLDENTTFDKIYTNKEYDHDFFWDYELYGSYPRKPNPYRDSSGVFNYEKLILNDLTHFYEEDQSAQITYIERSKKVVEAYKYDFKFDSIPTRNFFSSIHDTISLKEFLWKRKGLVEDWGGYHLKKVIYPNRHFSNRLIKHYSTTWSRSPLSDYQLLRVKLASNSYNADSLKIKDDSTMIYIPDGTIIEREDVDLYHYLKDSVEIYEKTAILNGMSNHFHFERIPYRGDIETTLFKGELEEYLYRESFDSTKTDPFYFNTTQFPQGGFIRLDPNGIATYTAFGIVIRSKAVSSDYRKLIEIIVKNLQKTKGRTTIVLE